MSLAWPAQLVQVERLPPAYHRAFIMAQPHHLLGSGRSMVRLLRVVEALDYIALLNLPHPGGMLKVEVFLREHTYWVSQLRLTRPRSCSTSRISTSITLPTVNSSP